MSLGGNYVFTTVMCLVLPMCILTSFSFVVCLLLALGMFIFVKVMSSFMILISLFLVGVPCLCVWWCSGVFMF